MLSVHYAECFKQAHYAECFKQAHYAECRYAECHDVECDASNSAGDFNPFKLTLHRVTIFNKKLQRLTNVLYARILIKT